MTYIYDFSTHCAMDRLMPCAYNQNAALLFSRLISPLQITLAFSLSCSNEKTGVSSRGEQNRGPHHCKQSGCCLLRLRTQDQDRLVG